MKDAAYRLENIERTREYDRARQSAPHRLELKRKQYHADRPKYLARMKQYAKNAPEVGRKAKAAYKARNPAKTLAATRKRQAGKLNATPAWANQFFIEEAYELARLRTEQKTGGFDEWQVDHIVPLQHPLVQGLHVEHNLQVIPALHNQQKGNRSWPDMPVEVTNPKGGLIHGNQDQPHL